MRTAGWAVAAAGVLLLTGCTGGGSPAPTATVTAPASGALSSSAPASSAPPSSAPTSSTPASAPASSAPSTTGGTGAIARCATADLRGSWRGLGGAAGTEGGELTLTNTGSTACTLQGWPGVSLVGDGNGTQLGAAAVETSSSHPTVRLAPGGQAQARVGIGTAEDYSSSTCRPATADGFRVYPPGDTASLFVRQREDACRSTAVKLLQVQALVPAG